MALIVGLVVAVVATPLAARLATRLGLVDQPGPLKVHTRAIPYLGGLAVFVALVAPVAGARAVDARPARARVRVGIADDATDLPPALRLAVEVGIGVAAAWVMAPHDVGHVALGMVLVLVLVNAVNMLDGLDGLATAVVAKLGAAGFFVVLSGSSATLALALVGALLGFLVWNAPPARVYLGDAGSYLLGAALAMLFLAATQYHAAVISSAFLFVGVPVADAAVAIVRRVRARTPLCEAIAGTCTTSSSTGAGRRDSRPVPARPRRPSSPASGSSSRPAPATSRSPSPRPWWSWSAPARSSRSPLRAPGPPTDGYGHDYTGPRLQL